MPDESKKQEVLGEDKPAQFDGTRWECEAFLDSYFSIQRRITEGALQSASLMNDEDDVDGYKKILDALGRNVYRVTVEPLGFATATPVRPENAYRAMRMQTSLEIFDAIVGAGDSSSDDKADSSDDNTDS